MAVVQHNTLTTSNLHNPKSIVSDTTDEIVTISGTNVGIAEKSPAHKLDIGGTARADSFNVNDAYTFPTADGNADEVIVTDGAGGTSFNVKVQSVGISGSSGLSDDVILASGSNITLSQASNVISIASEGGGVTSINASGESQLTGGVILASGSYVTLSQAGNTITIAGAADGATVALDNLASVAINTSLISDTDDTDDLGSAAKEWKDLYIDGTANIDSLVADTADINAGTWAGTIDGNWTALNQTCANLGTVSAATSITSTAFTGDITGEVTGGCSGNAGTATIFETARTINGVSFNGSANITVTADANTLTNTILKSTVVTSSLTALGTITSLVATTADINGGTWLGTIDGNWTATGQTCADLGAVTTADINGGTLDGVQIGGTTATGELFVNDASDNADGLGSQGTDGQVLTSAGAGANPTWTSAGGGVLVQEVYTQTGTQINTASAIPKDNTKPQSNEGEEAFTLAITPTSATSILRITVSLMIGVAGEDRQGVATLFQDAGTDAIAVGGATGDTGRPVTAAFVFHMVAGTESETTFKARFGADSGMSDLNGTGADAGLYNGVASSSMTIAEYTP